MTTITLPRATVEQALEALKSVEGKLWKPWSTDAARAADALRAALAQKAEPKPMSPEQRQRWEELAAMPQQAEPVEPVGRVVSANCEYATVQWLKQTSDVGGGAPKNSRSWPIAGDAVYTAPPQRAEPVQALNAWAADRLARHGIQACLYPQCVGGQSGTVCHKHCPTPCPGCRGLGYDASGQLCGCQGNPSF